MLIGYGEDSLTIAVLLTHTPRLLMALGDATEGNRVLTLYRPSFGRRAVSGRRGPPCVFGDFDAIIITPECTYLIESKRTGSSETEGAEVHLRKEQVCRHAVMRAYIEEWHATRATGWDDFIRRSGIAGRLHALGRQLPPSGSRLAENLRYVLNMASISSGQVQDVLLFLRDLSATGPNASPPTVVTEVGFVVVHARIDTINHGWTMIAPATVAPSVEFWLSPFKSYRIAPVP